MNENQRLIIAIVLILGIFVGWDLISKQLNPPVEPDPNTIVEADKSTPSSMPATPSPQNPSEIATDALPTDGEGNPIARIGVFKLSRDIEGNGFVARLDNGSPKFSGWKLQEYKAALSSEHSSDEPLELAERPQAAWTIRVDGQPIDNFDFQEGDTALRANVGNMNLTLQTRSTVEFGAEQALTFINNSAQPRRVEATLELRHPLPPEQTGGFAFFGAGRSAPKLAGLCFEPEAGSPTRHLATKLAKKNFKAEQGAHWAALDRQYFMFSVVPELEAALDCQVLKDGSDMVVRLGPWVTDLAAGQMVTDKVALYGGPKIDNALNEVAPTLGSSIEYGTFAFLSRPIISLLRVFHGWVGNWGLAIILLTFAIKMGTFPITFRSQMSMKKLAELKPLMDQIKERFPDDLQRQQEEQMKMYREHGVNPVTGCLPMLLQMPIWFALYRALWAAVDLYQQPFLWISDLTTAESGIPILAISASGLMLAQQLVTPMTADNAQAKMMRWIFPGMFFFILLSLPAGLALYMSVNSVLSILQQLVINRAYDAQTKGKGNGNKTKGKGGMVSAKPART